MKIIDTHSHLYDEAFATDRDEAVRRAADAGVVKMLLPAIDSGSVDALDKLHSRYPDVFFKMAGLHPTSVRENYAEELCLVEKQLEKDLKSYVAVGEIGLDFYWDDTFRKEQIEVLETQLAWARKYGLPVSLHVRKAYNEIFEILKKDEFRTVTGVFHCFGSSVQDAAKVLDLGFLIGVGGVVTFKNATLAEVVKNVPLEKILIETDAPYLAPVPFRGKRNESAYCVNIASKIAEIKNVDVEYVAEVTTANAVALFNL